MAVEYYLAYGSNLHPRRMIERAKSGKVVGTVEMTGYSLTFHKRSTDGSGKCSIEIQDGMTGDDILTFSSHRNDKNVRSMFGVLYAIDSDPEAGLRAAEDVDGYIKRIVSCPVNGKQYSGFTYVARSTHIDMSLKPYEWYKALVVAGAQYHRFPQEYVDSIIADQSIPDPDSDRSAEHNALLQELVEINASGVRI